jgi:hypothetical protein
VTREAEAEPADLEPEVRESSYFLDPLSGHCEDVARCWGPASAELHEFSLGDVDCYAVGLGEQVQGRHGFLKLPPGPRVASSAYRSVETRSCSELMVSVEVAQQHREEQRA